jgi:hypothetical protein
MDERLTKDNGPIGRDALPAFKFWSKKELVIERVLRTTADIFGPVGDHHGVRDRLGVSTVSKTLRKSILCKCISAAVSNKALKRLSL